MKLSISQKKQFFDDGYLIINNFFNQLEVGAMLKEMYCLIENKHGRNVVVSGETINYQIQPLVNHSNLFRALPYYSKVKDVVSVLIGIPYVRQIDQIFYKPSNIGAGTKWHTDNSYFGISDPTKGTGMWIALHDASVLNGTMYIIPGGHNYDYSSKHQRDIDTDHLISFNPDDSKAVPVEVDAGGVLFFNYGIPHCTKENITDTARAGCAYHFLRQDYIDYESYHHSGFESMEDLPVIAGPGSTGGMKEYGTLIEGTWEDEVIKVLN